MTLVHNIGQFHKFWSVRLGALALVFDAIAQVLPTLQSSISPGWFTALSVVSTVGALVARAIQQQEPTNASNP